jgi:hypothetical protein
MSNTAEPNPDSTKPVVPYYTPHVAPRVRWSFFDYFWFVFKNVIGWIFMLSSPVLGALIPGPGGIPLFLIGFALVTFPGKRRITSHVMRGRAVKVNPQVFTMVATIASVIVTASVIWLLYKRYKQILDELSIGFMEVFGICALAAAVTWIVMRLTVLIVNWLLRSMPRIRRFIRPWLRKWGINLLPPRRKLMAHSGELVHHGPDEILHFSDSYRTRLNSVGGFALAWLIRAVVVACTVLVVLFIFKPLLDRWNELSTGAKVWLVTAVVIAAGILLLAITIVLKRRTRK